MKQKQNVNELPLLIHVSYSWPCNLTIAELLYYLESYKTVTQADDSCFIFCFLSWNRLTSAVTEWLPLCYVVYEYRWYLSPYSLHTRFAYANIKMQWELEISTSVKMFMLWVPDNLASRLSCPYMYIRI